MKKFTIEITNQSNKVIFIAKFTNDKLTYVKNSMDFVSSYFSKVVNFRIPSIDDVKKFDNMGYSFTCKNN